MNFARSVVVPWKLSFGFFTAAAPRALFGNATCAASCFATILAKSPTLPENLPFATDSA